MKNRNSHPLAYEPSRSQSPFSRDLESFRPKKKEKPAYVRFGLETNPSHFLFPAATMGEPGNSSRPIAPKREPAELDGNEAKPAAEILRGCDMIGAKAPQHCSGRRTRRRGHLVPIPTVQTCFLLSAAGSRTAGRPLRRTRWIQHNVSRPQPTACMKHDLCRASRAYAAGARTRTRTLLDALGRVQDLLHGCLVEEFAAAPPAHLPVSAWARAQEVCPLAST